MINNGLFSLFVMINYFNYIVCDYKNIPRERERIKEN